MINYELIEHTADTGIRVKAKDLKGLFRNSALAMFDIIAEKPGAKSKLRKKIEIEQKADNLEELFVNWLNELLSLSAVKELIFTDFKINRLGNDYLSAVAIGSNVKECRVNVEIKAATYHELKIEKIKSGWQAEVIFDV